jgi:uncharacterized membrane protein YozB (DUF420 family)
MNPSTSSISPRRPSRLIVSILIGGLLLATAIFFATGGITHLAESPGIFGTKANLFTDLNLIAQILLLAGLVVGAYFARRGNITAHQTIQTGLVLFNLVLTIFIMAVAYFEYVVPGLPGELSQAHGLVATLHSLLGLCAILCGIYLILRMNHMIPKHWQIKKWKLLMRVTLGLYLLVGLIGLGVYFFWYVG